MESLLPLFLPLEKGDEGDLTAFQKAKLLPKKQNHFIARDCERHDTFPKTLGDKDSFADFSAVTRVTVVHPGVIRTVTSLVGSDLAYLLVDEGCAPTFKALIEETDWDHYGTGKPTQSAQLHGTLRL